VSSYRSYEHHLANSEETTMNITLWIVAGLLAVPFLAGGALKLAWTKEKLAASGFGFAEDFSAGTVKAIGALEVLAAVGVVLLMVGAVLTHLRRHEVPPVVVNLVLVSLAGLVAWGRFGSQPFTG
jgi:hypothetical protein